jgi:hypothetical protein
MGKKIAMITTDKMRDDFEEAYRDLHKWEREEKKFLYDESMDLYVDDVVQMAWWFWETATLKERARCAAIAAASAVKSSTDMQPLSDLRGILAAELICWHRLTSAEADNLLAFACAHDIKGLT